jgi:dUTP pyrophosphatase
MERTRGFEAVVEEHRKGTNEYILPVRGSSKSAGYDFSSPIDVIIEPHSSVLIWTNVKAYMQDDEVLEVYIRSSTAIKRDLILKNTVGIIDSDYYSNESNDGNIGICLYNTTYAPRTIKKGERIAQGIFKKYLVADDDVCLNDTRTGGIGSSGK